MGRASVASPLGIRVRMTPQELAAAQAYGASRKGLWLVVSIGFGAMAAICVLVMLGALASLGDDPHGDGGWLALWVGGTLLGLCLTFLWLARRQTRRIAADLALGTKVVVDGVVTRRGCNCKNRDCVYSIRVWVPPHKAPGTFSVPERVFKNLAEGDAVRCAYLPSARILLSLDSASVTYAIGADDGWSPGMA